MDTAGSAALDTRVLRAIVCKKCGEISALDNCPKCGDAFLYQERRVFILIQKLDRATREKLLTLLRDYCKTKNLKVVSVHETLPKVALDKMKKILRTTDVDGCVTHSSLFTKSTVANKDESLKKSSSKKLWQLVALAYLLISALLIYYQGRANVVLRESEKPLMAELMTRYKPNLEWQNSFKNNRFNASKNLSKVNPQDLENLLISDTPIFIRAKKITVRNEGYNQVIETTFERARKNDNDKPLRLHFILKIAEAASKPDLFAFKKGGPAPVSFPIVAKIHSVERAHSRNPFFNVYGDCLEVISFKDARRRFSVLGMTVFLFVWVPMIYFMAIVIIASVSVDRKWPGDPTRFVKVAFWGIFICLAIMQFKNNLSIIQAFARI